MSEAISNVRIFPVNKGNVKANGSFTVNGVVSIRFALINGKNGLFVALPRREYTDKEGNQQWSDEAYFTSKQSADSVTQVILAEFNKSQSTDTTLAATGTDDLPF